MSKTIKQHNFEVIDLAEGVLVCTPIPKDNYAALRSGFAGYPANPRWNVSKFRAWRMGRQWREALFSGEMVVRSTDSMLVLASEAEDKLEDNSQSSRSCQFPVMIKRVLSAYQMA